MNPIIIDECPICLEYLDNKMDIVIFECKHKFHLNCINKWFSKPRSNYMCPNCYVQRDVIEIIPKKIVRKDNLNNEKKKEKKCIVA